MKTIGSLVLLSVIGVGCGEGQFKGATSTTDKNYTTGDAAPSANPPSTGSQAPIESGPNSTAQTVEGSTSASLSSTCDASHSKENVHVRSSEQVVSIDAFANPSIKVTGSRNQVTVKLAKDQSVGTLCLDISGGENKVFFEIDGKIGEISIKARGDDPALDILTNADASIERVTFDDDKHFAQTVLHGPGKHPCDPSRLLICK